MSADQRTFAAALLDANLPTPEGLGDGAHGPAGRRFSVYRNNVVVGLTEALETGFPTIRKLLGSANFRRVAGLYVRRSPPASPLMMHYGGDFPEFLAGFPPLSHIGYLADVARLELALRSSYHAADAEPIEAEALARIPAEAMGDVRLALAPSVRVLRSPWPIYDIWRYNTEEAAEKPRAIAQDVLVVRPDLDPEPHALQPGDAASLDALATGGTLGDALEAGRSISADHDLGSLLKLLLNGRAIVHISTEDIQ